MDSVAPITLFSFSIIRQKKKKVNHEMQIHRKLSFITFNTQGMVVSQQRCPRKITPELLPRIWRY